MTTKNLLLDILENRRDSMLRQRHDRAVFSYTVVADMAAMASADAAALRGAQTIAEQARNERDAAVQANERKERELVELQARVRQLESQRNDARNDLIAAQGFCDKLRGDLKALSGQRDNEAQKAAALLQTCAGLREEITALRNENSDLHNRVKTLSLKPVQYGAGGAASGCNNSVDAAKAQTSKPDFVKICREQLDTCLRDGSWISYAELRNYVTHTATYGEQGQ